MYRMHMLVLALLIGCGSAKVASQLETPQGPPPAAVVQPCNAIPANAGWQQITPPGDLGDAQAIQVDPLNVGRVFVQMHKGGNGAHYPTDGLYVSNDCGANWSRVAQGRNSSDPGTNINSGSFSSLIIDPYNSNVMYAVSNYGPGGVWKSLNGGVDWDQMVPNSVGQYVNSLWFNALDIDPTNHNHLVAANHAGCSGPYAPNCIAESRDAGATWDLIPAPIGWSEGNGVYIINDQTLVFGTNNDGAFVTTDDGATWKKVAPGASGAGAGTPVYKAPDGTYYFASAYGVFATSDLVNWNNVYNGQFRQFVGTGTNLYTTNFWSPTYFTAAQATPTQWQPLGASTAPTGSFGGVYMVYDQPHHILYSSNYGVGLWRISAQ
jgi:photosystem II stability/assembly factor-like uncharacterized protein